MKTKHVMLKSDKIYVAGHRGMAGAAIIRRLQREGFENIITRSHAELDLTDRDAVNDFFRTEKPDYVFLAAAKVGGIQANREAQDQFLYANTMIAFHVIMSAFENHVKKLCFLGSSCIYPRECPQPIREEYLLASPLEITNEGYALAKISGLKLCEYLNTKYPDRADFISVMPCNLYGPGDNYHPEHSHVIPALLRRFHEAKESARSEILLWGTGSARREFLHVDDMADACFFLMQNYSGDAGVQPFMPGISWVNAGYGRDITVRELGEKIAAITGFEGDIFYDAIHPDGTPKKLLDSSKLFRLGWKPRISLEEGLRKTYEDYRVNQENYRK